MWKNNTKEWRLDGMRILLVEDEKRLAEALQEILQRDKHQVESVHDGISGLAYGEMGDYDLVILDVMLPGLNGYEVVRQLRGKKVTTPVLMLTARDTIGDKVTGLDYGADDYMTKPFAPEELLARVRALTRRPGEVILEELAFGDLRLQLASYQLSCGSRSLHLGYKEFEVLRMLMTSPQIVLSKEDIITKVWGSDSSAEDNNVEAYISFLRKKFFHLGSQVGITTLRKVGYRLEVGEDA